MDADVLKGLSDGERDALQILAAPCMVAKEVDGNVYIVGGRMRLYNTAHLFNLSSLYYLEGLGLVDEIFRISAPEVPHQASYCITIAGMKVAEKLGREPVL